MIATKIEHKCKVFHIYIDTVREAEHESEIDQVVKRPTLRLKLGCIIYIYIYICMLILCTQHDFQCTGYGI
jgi:hypothetical protein